MNHPLERTPMESPPERSPSRNPKPEIRVPCPDVARPCQPRSETERVAPVERLDNSRSPFKLQYLLGLAL